MAYYPSNIYGQQQRLAQLEQQYPQFGGFPQFQQYQQPVQGIKGRPVTGIDEAKAAQIDFDGSMHIFPDISNGRIYTKQIGTDGLPVFAVYERKIAEAETPVNYVSMDEFNALKEKVETLIEGKQKKVEK